MTPERDQPPMYIYVLSKQSAEASSDKQILHTIKINLLWTQLLTDTRNVQYQRKQQIHFTNIHNRYKECPISKK